MNVSWLGGRITLRTTGSDSTAGNLVHKKVQHTRGKVREGLLEVFQELPNFATLVGDRGLRNLVFLKGLVQEYQ